MKKMTINLSDAAHAELLKLQLKELIETGKKPPLAEIAANYIHSELVEKEKPTD